MIHEDITISGSFLVSGSFTLPRVASSSLADATTGSMFYDTSQNVVKIYTGEGLTGYVAVGDQSVPVYNPSNDAERRTLEDIFWKRKFSSYIYKESNVYDRKIDTYKASLDLLLESKRIEHVIFEFEQDLWEY